MTVPTGGIVILGMGNAMGSVPTMVVLNVSLRILTYLPHSPYPRARERERRSRHWTTFGVSAVTPAAVAVGGRDASTWGIQKR